MSEPLTEEERAELADLQYRAAMEDWTEAEADRVAELAKYEPIVTAFGGGEAFDTMLEALEACGTDLGEECAQRLNRLLLIMRFDARGLIARHTALSVAAPAPEAPTEPDPA